MQLSSRRRFASPTAPISGSVLLTAMLTVTVLSIIAANVLLSISSRYSSAYRSASWNEALTTAEAGTDAVAAEISRLVPNVIPGVNSLGNGYSQPSPPLISNLLIGADGTTINGVTIDQLKDGTILSVATLDLYHGGEGSTHQQASISVQLKLLSTLLQNGAPSAQTIVQNTLASVKNVTTKGDLPLLRVISTGTVDVTGGHLAGMSRQDNDLWRVALYNNPNGQAAVDKPQVSRQVEMYLRPVFAFESAAASNDSFLAANPLAVFDSFNPLTGPYDSHKRGSNATLRANGATVNLGGNVYGNVYTNGGNVAKDSHVTGTVNNASYCPLPIFPAPTWNGETSVPSSILGLFTQVPSSVTGPTTLPAGTLAPKQYRFTGISSSLHITRGLSGTGTNVEIFVDGDVTGSIEIDPGIAAKLYVSGSLITNASQLKNDTGLAADLQIYGVPSSNGGSPQISINVDTALFAAIYAPLHRITLNGSGDVYGAAVGATFLAPGALCFHYDESLAYATGVPLLRYQTASWKEITPN